MADGSMHGIASAVTVVRTVATVENAVSVLSLRIAHGIVRVWGANWGALSVATRRGIVVARVAKALDRKNPLDAEIVAAHTVNCLGAAFAAKHAADDATHCAEIDRVVDALCACESLADDDVWA